MKTYWHISAKENRESILKNGIKSDDEGYIYLINSLYEELHVFDIKISIPDSIAINQVWLKEYDLFEINSEGLTSKILRDNVSEKYADCQNRIKQSIIQPEFIQFTCHQKVNIKEVIKFDNYKSFVSMHASHLNVSKKQAEKIRRTDNSLDSITKYLNEIIKSEIESKMDLIKKFEE